MTLDFIGEYHLCLWAHLFNPIDPRYRNIEMGVRYKSPRNRNIGLKDSGWSPRGI